MKLTFEIDTKTKTMSLMQDGKAIDPDSFCISSYSVDNYGGGDTDYVNICMSNSDDNGVYTSTTVSLNADDGDEEAEASLKTSIANEVKKLVNRERAAKSISRLLSKKNK